MARSPLVDQASPPANVHRVPCRWLPVGHVENGHLPDARDADHEDARTVRLTESQARDRLRSHDHAVLCTVHPQRGTDAVPVVYAVDGEHLGIPVDSVKPKASMRLQRERNLESDPRATLLADHWDREDWSRLWWVRAELRWQPDASQVLAATFAGLLADRYPQYQQYQDQPFERVLVFQILALSGWAAEG